MGSTKSRDMENFAGPRSFSEFPVKPPVRAVRVEYWLLPAASLRLRTYLAIPVHFGFIP